MLTSPGYRIKVSILEHAVQCRLEDNAMSHKSVHWSDMEVPVIEYNYCSLQYGEINDQIREIF